MNTRQAKRSNHKVHTSIGHSRAPCGVLPHADDVRVVTYSSFFSALPKDQCATCIKRLKARGYNIEIDRIRYRAIYDHAQELALIA